MVDASVELIRLLKLTGEPFRVVAGAEVMA